MRQIRRVYFSTHPKTAASQPHTDYSRVDRVESVAPLDAKRPYSTLMFSRKERKGRKERTPRDADPDLITTSCQIIWLPAQDHYCQGGLTPQFRGKSAAPVSASARKQPLRGTRSHSYTVKHIQKGPTPFTMMSPRNADPFAPSSVLFATLRLHVR